MTDFTCIKVRNQRVSFAAIFGMSRNAPPKEMAAHIRTTFLSLLCLWFACIAAVSLGGALRDIPRNGCEGD